MASSLWNWLLFTLIHRDKVKWVCATLNEGYLRAGNRGSKQIFNQNFTYQPSMKRRIFWTVFSTVFLDCRSTRLFSGNLPAMFVICFCCLSCLVVLIMVDLIGPLMWHFWLHRVIWLEVYINYILTLFEFSKFSKIRKFYLTIKPQMWIIGLGTLSENAPYRGFHLRFQIRTIKGETFAVKSANWILNRKVRWKILPNGCKNCLRLPNRAFAFYRTPHWIPSYSLMKRSSLPIKKIPAGHIKIGLWDDFSQR